MKVGLLYPRSGPAGIWAPSLDAAALLATAEINARGGVCGRPIDIATQDCGHTVAAAVEAAETLIEVDGVDLILGAHPSDLRDPISHRVRGRAGYIYTSQYEGLDCGPSTLAIGSEDEELLRPALNWLKDAKRAERFYFVGEDYVWPRTNCAAARRLVREQGGQWLGESFLPAMRGDDSELMKRLARSGAQVVVLALVGQNAIDFNRAFAAAGLDEKMLRFGLIVDETVICGIGAEASVNLYTAAHYFAASRSRENDSFLERYHDAFGEWAPPISASSARYYQGVRFLADLAQSAGAARGPELARHLDRRMSRRIAKDMLGAISVGGHAAVHLAEADGVTLRVVSQFAV